MKRGRGNKDQFAQFEADQSQKRQGKKFAASGTAAPTDLTVQLLTTQTNNRKKYDPLDVRVFVAFRQYEELNLENIKAACEKHYGMPAGTCDVLVSNTGPSVERFDRIKNKKSYFIRFTENLPQPPVAAPPINHSSEKAGSSQISPPPPPKSQFAKSISIATLLKAGKLKKAKKIDKITMEYYSLENETWQKLRDGRFEIEEKSFSEGAFRSAFKAIDVETKKTWVLKKYLDTSKTTMEQVGTTVEEHCRKQCQMHSVARNICQRMEKKTKDLEFGDSFSYERVYFGFLGDEPITLEEFIPGFFIKYVNDGNCYDAHTKEAESVYKKAQSLVHFSIDISGGKIILTDIQGSLYKLYDPEISTLIHQDEDSEFYFCTGNLSLLAFRRFQKEHQCNEFCRMMKLKPLEPMAAENDDSGDDSGDEKEQK